MRRGPLSTFLVHTIYPQGRIRWDQSEVTSFSCSEGRKVSQGQGDCAMINFIIFFGIMWKSEVDDQQLSFLSLRPPKPRPPQHQLSQCRTLPLNKKRFPFSQCTWTTPGECLATMWSNCQADNVRRNSVQILTDCLISPRTSIQIGIVFLPWGIRIGLSWCHTRKQAIQHSVCICI